MKELGRLACGSVKKEKNPVIKLDQLTLCNSVFLDPYKILRLCCY